MGAGLKHITQGMYDDCVYVSLNKLRIISKYVSFYTVHLSSKVTYINSKQLKFKNCFL
jgi:hypothetical protein